MPKIDTSKLKDHIRDLLFMVDGKCVCGAYVESFDKDSIYILTAEGIVELKDTMSLYETSEEAIKEAGPNPIIKK